MTRLVRDQNALSEDTAIQETDVRTALTRGLAEYIQSYAQTLGGMPTGGRVAVLKAVFSDWAEPGEEAEYPSVSVYTSGRGQYVHAGPPQPRRDRRLGDRYVVKLSEYQTDVTVDLWTEDPAQRAGLVAHLEAAFFPVDWMLGFRLDLPHYFGQRATYLLSGVTHLDAEDAARKRVRRALFELTASVALVQLRSFPEAKPRARVEVVNPDVVLTG